MPTRIPFVIDNDTHGLGGILRVLLADTNGKPCDIATAYFSISGYRLVKDGLHRLGAFRLLIGSDPQSGTDVGLRPNEKKTVQGRLKEDLEAEPFTEETLKLVEGLIAFLRSEKVEVRLYDKGFLHAKAYLFHQDIIGPSNRADRLRPYAAIVGSSNFTGPGLTTNRELNLVHRVIVSEDEAIDREAAERVGYLTEQGQKERETILDPSGIEVPRSSRRQIKSEVGARAITDLMRWYEEQWAQSVDFKDDLIELLDSSKFGALEYTPYQIYTKALYEYFKEELGEDAPELGRSAVDLAEFQADAVKKARRILSIHDGVLIADSVGLGKTWIGKKLLEDYAYHQRQKAVVICPASIRNMWRKELASATIAAEVIGMEEMGREEFDETVIGDADVLLIDESHNFRNHNANRYLKLDSAIQLRGGRGKGGDRKKIILLSATPINNDLYDLRSQVQLFTQNEADYFRDIGIGDLNAYFRRARTLARRGEPAGVLLFNLLEEIMVRNTRPYIRMAYPNATINGEKVSFPDRKLHTVKYDLGATYGGLYDDIVDAIENLSLAPYKLEEYRKKSEIRDEQEHEWETGRELALVGIFKCRFLKRLESSIYAFRKSLSRALRFEETYLEYLLDGKIVSSTDVRKALRFLAAEAEDDLGIGSVADQLDAVEEAKEYIESLPKVDLTKYDLRKLRHDVQADVDRLKDLYTRTEPLAKNDGKLEKLKDLILKKLTGQKVLVFSSFKDTSRYLHSRLTEDASSDWRTSVGDPRIRRIDGAVSPDDRGRVLELFAPLAHDKEVFADDQIDILISTDVLSEGQNLQDCGVIINYDLTWNPIRLVQRNGRIDRLMSKHKQISIFNMFPERELEKLLHLVERLTGRISVIDEIGLLDASVLGEVVHPRTFNVLRRIMDEDGTVLNEEEERAELAGPEMLLKQLREMLGREGSEALTTLPNGIHSGLRRKKCHGMFFYFQAPRPSGQGKRHFWRYIDANTYDVKDNRYEIAQTIACLPDEPRYIGDQDVFALQEKVIEHILQSELEAEAKAAAPTAVDPIQQVIDQILKDTIRRGSADREEAKRCIQFLGQSMGKALHRKLKNVHNSWSDGRDDQALLNAVGSLADQYAKDRPASEKPGQIQRADLDLICFEYVSS